MTSKKTPSSHAHLLSVDAMGVRVDLHLADDAPVEIASRIGDAWRDCATSAAGETSRVGAGVDTAGAGSASGRRHRRTLDMSAAAFDDPERGLSDLSTRVTLEALDALRGTRLLLHAAGVATDDGRTIALVGPSGRGKTTASRHLGIHFSYVSDETVAVADDLSVQAYRKPLSVITDGLAHKQQIAPTTFGLKQLPDVPLRLAALTLIERQPDAEAVGPIVVDAIDAICEMTPQISYLPELPTPIQHLARLFDAVGAPTRLIYRDAADLPALIREMFDAPLTRAPAWSLPVRAERSGPWRATDFDDAIVVDGRACVLRDGVVTALDQRGRLVWMQCLAGASAAEMVTAAVSEFGDPGEGLALDLIAATLDELRSHGFIEPA